MKKTPLVVAAIAAAVLVTAACGARQATSKGGRGRDWHAQRDEAQKAMHKLVGQFNKSHPGIVVRDQLGSNGDSMVQKLQAVIGSDNYPDIAYVYGSDVPNVAQSSKVVDIAGTSRRRVRVEQPVRGRPRDGHRQGQGRRLPRGDRQPRRRLQHEDAQGGRRRAAEADWTWADYRAMAKKLTNASKDIVGAGFPISGSEDTVWRLWPMIWQQGGEVLDKDNKKALFAGPRASRRCSCWPT